MRRAGLLAVLVLALGLAGCSHQSAKTAGRLTVTGHARVTSGGGGTTTVTKVRTLKSGDQVRMVDGTAELGLGDGRELQLRKGTVVRLSVQPSATGSLQTQGELLSGDVLVLASSDAATVVAGDTTVQVTGVARVSRGLATVTGVYQGAAGVETAGKSVSVPALRQVTVPAPGLPSRPNPLSYSASDPWDQRYLGDAIDLGNQLVARSTGFSAQLAAGSGPSVAFFRQILPALTSQPFDASLLSTTTLLSTTLAPGETLVGAAITLVGAKGQFADRWASVFAFHGDGASWGLVALDQGAARTAVLSTVDGAIARAGLGGNQLAAPAPAGGAPSPTIPVPVVVTTVPSTPTGGTAPTTVLPTTVPTTVVGTGPPGSTSPSLDAPKGPLQTGVPLLDDTARAVVDALSGLLKSLAPS